MLNCDVGYTKTGIIMNPVVKSKVNDYVESMHGLPHPWKEMNYTRVVPIDGGKVVGDSHKVLPGVLCYTEEKCFIRDRLSQDGSDEKVFTIEAGISRFNDS